MARKRQNVALRFSGTAPPGEGAEAPVRQDERAAVSTDAAQTKNPRLRFSEEKTEGAPLDKAKRKAVKAEAKLDKAKSHIPTKKELVIERATDARTGNQVARLRFEKKPVTTPQGKSPGAKRGKKQTVRQFADEMRRVPDKALHSQGKDDRQKDDVGNVGAEAGEKALAVNGRALQFGEKKAGQIRHAQELRPFRKMEQAENRLDKANVNYLQKQEAYRNPTATSNPLSRWRQRREVRKGYYAAQKTGSASAHTTKRLSEKVSDRVGQVFRKNRKGLTVGGLLFLMVAMVLNGLSSCAPLVQSGFQAIAISTYPADESEMKAAERMYAAMEKELQSTIDHYERNHDYDEYHYDVDDIWHDPHALMAIISAWYGGEVWTADQAYGTLEMLFGRQYKFTETIERETRYRQEQRTGYYTYTDPETGETERRSYTYYVDVPYYYYIAHIQLINENLSHLPIYIMSRERVGMYAMYKSTLGNYPDLFRGNRYASRPEEPMLYDVPEETLENDNFARLIEEAQKYLGYPYVWGGDDPSTSFDCSGFISWVYTQSGVLNTGRLGATSLYGICKPITMEEAMPGDMVFFQGTLNRNEGITHVGMYVGNGMMIHCGSPITFADLSDRYWIEHMYGFGHPPIDLGGVYEP